MNSIDQRLEKGGSANEPRKSGFTYIGRYVSPVLFQSSLFPTFDGDPETGMLPMDEGVFLDGYEYIQKGQWTAIINAAYAATKSQTGGFFKNFFSLAKKGTERALQASQKVQEGGELTAKAFQDFVDVFHEMMYPWWSTLPIGEGMEKAVLEDVKNEGLSEKVAESVFEQDKHAPLQIHRMEMVRLREKWEAAGRNDERIREDLDGLVKRFEWVGMLHLWGSPLTAEKALLELKALPPQIKHQQVLDTPVLLEPVKPFAGELCYWRQYCADVCSMISFNVLNQFEQASKLHGINYADTLWLTKDEFVGMLEGNTAGLLEGARERRKAYGLVFRRGEYEIITGARLTRLKDAFVEKKAIGDSVKGMPASPGVARGIVRIIWTPKETNKMKKGDILVASETTPDFMPGIYQAAAIVTDMGGITSHAAVIAREFGIPCVVGTKNATRVFKDCDLVEVDADRGIVRKIKAENRKKSPEMRPSEIN